MHESINYHSQSLFQTLNIVRKKPTFSVLLVKVEKQDTNFKHYDIPYISTSHGYDT